MGMKDKGKKLKEAAKEVMGTGKKDEEAMGTGKGEARQRGREAQDRLKERREQESRQSSFDDLRDENDDR
ncbi:hypothetical protein [Streptomyces sp. NPDC059979]|uniref:hypothetical protein n=1 Tax=Streptomyces sp. NPDC059979 TaxID=3347021 RepID=UPI0036C79FE3